MLKWSTVLFLLGSLGVQAAGNVLIKPRSSDYLRAKVTEALSLLPNDYLNSVKGSIEIEEVQLKSDEFMGPDLCNLHDKTIFGRAINLPFGGQASDKRQITRTR